jgi:hypothetical protein
MSGIYTLQTIVRPNATEIPENNGENPNNSIKRPDTQITTPIKKSVVYTISLISFLFIADPSTSNEHGFSFIYYLSAY